MRPAVTESWRYARALVVLVGVSFGLSAFLWVPLCLGLLLWFGGSALTAVQSHGRGDALVAHGQWTEVSSPVFHAVLYSEVLAIAATLTLFTCLLSMWLARRDGDA